MGTTTKTSPLGVRPVSRSFYCSIRDRRGGMRDGRGRVGGGKGVKEGEGWEQQRPHHSESDL